MTRKDIMDGKGGVISLSGVRHYFPLDDYWLDCMVARGFLHFKYNEKDKNWYCPIKEVERVIYMLKAGLLML